MNSPYDEPAFPSKEVDYNESFIQSRTVYGNEYTGMTLRDYFAAKAMPLVYNEFMTGLRNKEFSHPGPEWRYGLAQDSYQMADAMLKVREL